ncbi:hypothetical protein [Streptomyces acidiscabies]|uniref:Uncharacterized protein n=1 Tax=Streptomyces acidiscabies TaxID=42234 RepID=A0AAP6BKI6_9ACTN|nr:hypothetical protein [Streptomyces acidiscabies]MBZ3918122.1 hypothetical protein [Streptomyces acidiscabies]MDX2966429.1 hypothetical protein [Streptomyces acidiscabies]MDX3796375.1 hypothetical protein [Streptomyces acidiscabies]
MPAQNKAERRAANQLDHFEKRQTERAQRGPRGLAESWLERARAVAAQREKDGDPEAWNDLSRTVATWVSRYEA